MIDKTLLEDWANRYEVSSFILTDPIQYPHRYSQKVDIEISAFLTSWIAYGNRKCILERAEWLDLKMNRHPYLFIKNREYECWHNSNLSFYRFFRFADLYDLCNRLNEIYVTYENMEDAIISKRNNQSPLYTMQVLFNGVKGIPSIKSASACKRLCMFLRWMIRSGNVDFGIWSRINQMDLLIPIDTHVYKMATSLGITKRKNIDIKTAEEITGYFKQIFPNDPARGDFSLYGRSVQKENG